MKLKVSEHYLKQGSIKFNNFKSGKSSKYKGSILYINKLKIKIEGK